jgi:hypothetical protein
MPVAGYKAKLYFLSTGTRASWGAADGEGRASGPAPMNLTEVPNVEDINIPLDDEKANVTTRNSGGFKAYLPTLTDVEISIPQVYDVTDTGFLALLKAKLTKTSIALAILEGANSVLGVEGLWGDFIVHGMEKGEKLGDAQMVTWKVAPAFTAVPMEWIIVAAS